MNTSNPCKEGIMSLTPFSAESLRGLRATTAHENHLKRVNEYIRTIYTHVIRRAKETDETSFKYQFYSENFDTFDMYMNEIVNGLKDLFPGCSVKHTTFYMGMDGKMHDIIQIDEQTLHFMSRKNCKEYIVVDWSTQL
jgi:hypothetical protein